MKDVVVSFSFRCSEWGALLESDVGRAAPIRGEKCRTKVSEGENHVSLVRRNTQLTYEGQRCIPCWDHPSEPWTSQGP